MCTGEQLDKAFIKHLGQHLVAMCGSYVDLNDQGDSAGPPNFYSYTGTVFEILGKWCIATAGHCLQKLEEASNHKKILIETQVLADYFGPNATNNMTIPFKPLEEGFLHVDEDGLDFASLSSATFGGETSLAMELRHSRRSNGIFRPTTNSRSTGLLAFQTNTRAVFRRPMRKKW